MAKTSIEGFLPARSVVMVPKALRASNVLPTSESVVLKTVQGPADKSARLAVIQSGLQACPRCKLCAKRTHVVFGEGNPDSPLMFVGEGPGEQEDRSGRPFVGKAGQLLDKMIQAMGLSREGVYIANIVKCRPPGNRYPEPDEVAACRPFLMEQIEIVKPQVIVTLGKCATQSLLENNEAISRARGRFKAWNGIDVMPTFHPSYLLRTPEAKKDAWEDLKKVCQRLEIPIPAARGGSR